MTTHVLARPYCAYSCPLLACRGEDEVFIYLGFARRTLLHARARALTHAYTQELDLFLMRRLHHFLFKAQPPQQRARIFSLPILRSAQIGHSRAARPFGLFVGRRTRPSHTTHQASPHPHPTQRGMCPRATAIRKCAIRHSPLLQCHEALHLLACQPIRVNGGTWACTVLSLHKTNAIHSPPHLPPSPPLPRRTGLPQPARAYYVFEPRVLQKG